MTLYSTDQKIRCDEDDVLVVQLGKGNDRFNVTLKNERTNWPSWGAFKIFNYFPERKRLDMQTRMEVPATDISVQVIDTLWPNDVEFFDEESRIAFGAIKLKAKSHDIKALRVAEFKESKKVPEHNWELHPDFALSGYQQVALCNSMFAESYCLFMEQGTGKTPVVIARICNEAEKIYAKEKRMYRVLIVCPKNVRANWEHEIGKFTTCCGKIQVLDGTQMDRFKQMLYALKKDPEHDCKFTVVICSYDVMHRAWDQLIGFCDWDLAVLDESQYIKSSSTKRWSASRKLREQSRQRMVLTGTPIANKPVDIWTQFEFTGRGISGFAREKNFQNFYQSYVERYSDGHKQFAGMQNVRFMKERLARYSFIITKKEALPDLPDKVYDIIDVEMTLEQSEAYIKLQQELVVEIQNDMESGQNDELFVNNILTKMLKLTQITSGFLKFPEELDEDGNVVNEGWIHRFDPNPKIEELVSILKEKQPHEKTIIWCSFVQDIKTLAARLKIEGLDCVTYYGATSDAERKNNEFRFNCDPNCRIFIGNAGAGGTGLNLLGYDYRNQTNDPKAQETETNHVIYMSQDWSSLKRMQSEDRAHRRGTKNKVRYTDLMVRGTIDQQIRERVVDKRMMANSISDIREILKSMVNKNE